MVALTKETMEYIQRENKPMLLGFEQETVEFLKHTIYHLCQKGEYSKAMNLSKVLFDCVPMEVPGMIEICEKNDASCLTLSHNRRRT